MTHETLNQFNEARKEMDNIRNEYIQEAKKELDSIKTFDCTKEKRGVVGHEYTVFVAERIVAGLKAKLEFFIYLKRDIDEGDHYVLDYLTLTCEEVGVKVSFQHLKNKNLCIRSQATNSDEITETMIAS